MRVLICGGQTVGMVAVPNRGGSGDVSADLIQASRVREDVHNKLDELNARFGFQTVMLCGKGGAKRLGLNWATAAKVPVEDYKARRFLSFREAEDKVHERILTKGRPELLVDFSGADYTNRLCLAAERSGIPVIKYQA
jgi:hypothetical protein